MSTDYFRVRQFHEKFKIGYDGPPRLLPPELAWRREFLNEELREYDEAVATGDLAKAFDALIDLVYVAIGSAVLHGFPWEAGFAEVHKANMAKRLSVEGEGRGTNDIVKPQGWTPPNMEEVLADFCRWNFSSSTLK